MNSNNTQINEDQVVYILKYKKNNPVMYFPLEGDNITDTTVKRRWWSLVLLLTQYIFKYRMGKVNQDLHVKHGARMVPDGTANKCIGNLATCTNGLSIQWRIRGFLEQRGHRLPRGDTNILFCKIFPIGIERIWTPRGMCILTPP